MPKTKSKETTKDFTAVYAFHGIELEPSGTQHVGDCPFCEEDSHFYVDIETGLFDCKKCFKNGNVYTFLKELHSKWQAKTKDLKLRSLAKSRNLPPQSTKEAGFAFDAINRRWLLPIYNRNGSLSNIRTYHQQAGKRILYNTPAPIITHLYNSQHLKHAEDTIYICEGEWDAIALEQAFRDMPRSKRPNATVVAVPGAGEVNVFTTKIIPLLQGKKVVLLYDHDKAGTEGMQKLALKLSRAGVHDLHLLNWPDSYPKGHDLSDHLYNIKLPPEKAWQEILEWIEPYSSDLSHVNHVAHADTDYDIVLPVRSRFSQVLRDFRDKGVHVNKALEGGIALTAACGISNDLPGDPLWLFLVGPSGTGKSLVLESTMPSKSYIYRTTTHYRDLASGYQGEGDDNTTLLYKLIGRTFVIKDYTTVLTMSQQELLQMNGLLRDAYDGHLHLSWGNGKEISYEGYFSIVAGVTHKIHTQQNSNLGERFLKYEIAGPQGLGDRRAIVQALRGGINSADDVNNRKYRQASFSSFVDGLRERMKTHRRKHTLTDANLDCIIAMSQFVALCRSVVERDRQGALLYEPSPEAGTRLAKQLSKLPQALCYVYGLKRPDDNIIDIVRKTAWDTAYSRMRKVYSCLYSEAGSGHNEGLTNNELAEAIYLPKTTLRRTVEDMVELGIVKKQVLHVGKRSRPENIHRLVPAARQLYQDCGFPS